MMTGHIEMDTPNKSNTVSACNSSIELSGNEFNGETNVATLDVTSEEINCNSKTWPSLVFADHSPKQARAGLGERQRSETWTYGLSNKQIKPIENDLNNKKVDDESNAQRHSFSPNTQQKTETARNKHLLSIPKKAEKGGNVKFSSENDNSFLSNQAKVSTVPNGCEASLSEDEAFSEFTDINLSRSCISPVPEQVRQDDEEKIAVGSASPTFRRQTMGSIFDWVAASSRNSDTPPAVPSNSLSSAQNPSKTFSGLKMIRETIRSTVASASSNYKRQSLETYSTTALILEDRPGNLPTKSDVEAEKHRAQYEKMVVHAKKLSQKDIKRKQKQLKELKKQEQVIVNSSSVWVNEILPNWQSTHQTSRTRQLWWQGLPPNVRGKVWQLAIGNELNITKELYSIMVTRAHDKLKEMNGSAITDDETGSIAADRENTVDLIRLDISRTFPHLCIFQKGGPYHELLHDVLGAYACYRPDVGYVQGMSFMAAMLLLNMEPANAFVTFANLLNKPCQVAFFRLNEEMMQTYFAAFEVFFEENLPKLFAHFKVNNLTPDMYLIDWIFTMFSKALDLDTASRVWDVFCRDGEDFLFRTAIAILKLNRDILLPMEFILAAQYLTRLPTSFHHQKLFAVISEVTMTSRGNRRWKDVLSLMRDTN